MLRTGQIITNAIYTALEGNSTFKNVDSIQFQADMEKLRDELSDNFEEWKRIQADACLSAYDMVENVLGKYLSGDMLKAYMDKIIDALDEDLAIKLKSVGIEISKEEAEDTPFPHNHVTGDVTILFDGRKMWVGDQYTYKDETFVPTEEQIAAYMQLLAEKHHNSWVQ